MFSFFNKDSKPDILEEWDKVSKNKESERNITDVYEAIHFIFTDMKHHNIFLKKFERISDNEYEITLSNGYIFRIPTDISFGQIPVRIADEFNRHYREDICHFI